MTELTKSEGLSFTKDMPVRKCPFCQSLNLSFRVYLADGLIECNDCECHGPHDHSMRRDRPYNGQPHTCTGTRGATEIRGVTFRDLRDCFVRAVLLSTGADMIDGVDMRPRYEEANKGEAAALCENDLYGFNLDKLDPMAIAQNLACEVERVMGIFPNVPGLTCDAPPEGIPGA